MATNSPSSQTNPPQQGVTATVKIVEIETMLERLSISPENGDLTLCRTDEAQALLAVHDAGARLKRREIWRKFVAVQGAEGLEAAMKLAATEALEALEMDKATAPPVYDPGRAAKAKLEAVGGNKFMSEQRHLIPEVRDRHVLASHGDLYLIVKDESMPLPRGSGSETSQPASGMEDLPRAITYRVSSATLENCSGFFRRLLFGNTPLSRATMKPPEGSGRPWIVTLTLDSPGPDCFTTATRRAAMHDMLCLMHGKLDLIQTMTDTAAAVDFSIGPPLNAMARVFSMHEVMLVSNEYDCVKGIRLWVRLWLPRITFPDLALMGSGGPPRVDTYLHLINWRPGVIATSPANQRERARMVLMLFAMVCELGNKEEFDAGLDLLIKACAGPTHNGSTWASLCGVDLDQFSLIFHGLEDVILEGRRKLLERVKDLLPPKCTCRRRVWFCYCPKSWPRLLYPFCDTDLFLGSYQDCIIKLKLIGIMEAYRVQQDPIFETRRLLKRELEAPLKALSLIDEERLRPFYRLLELKRDKGWPSQTWTVWK